MWRNTMQLKSTVPAEKAGIANRGEFLRFNLSIDKIWFCYILKYMPAFDFSHTFINTGA